MLAASFLLVLSNLTSGILAHAQTFGCSPAMANDIVCENSKPGNPPADWSITGAGDSTLQGFATDMSVAQGGTVSFKINTTASAYTIDIYRLGYYAGNGARKIASVSPAVTLPQTQPACLTDSNTFLYDCGNWAVSATWQVPSNATSGIYFALLTRQDTGGVNQIFFIVRNDASHSDMLYQTSDETWQAYNAYGGHTVYGGLDTWDLPNRAYKVSYNRPFITRAFDSESATFVFGSEHPMIRWLEANGYDVTYTTCIDAVRNGSLIQNHKIYLDSGHDEYWSGPHRASVEAALAAGVNLAFFSGNEVFWKTRWENSIDGTNTPYRTLVVYKETLANMVIDPDDPPTWTGTWRDPRFSPPADGGRPENALTGTIFMVNGPGTDNPGDLSIQVPAADGKMRFWRNTSIATQSAGQIATLPQGTLGYEWDEDLDNGARPAGLIDLSTATYNMTQDLLLDYGGVYGGGSATHHMTLYRAPSGALVFGAGTVQWAWGLDSNHDNPFFSPNTAPDVRMQQATVNLFADMGVQPSTLQSGLVAATKSTDTTPPTSTITFPAAGSTQQLGSSVTITGTAADQGGGVVGGVEVSTDGGQTWHPASGRGSWTYTWLPTVSGSIQLMSRAVDDSGNLETPSAGVTVVVPKSPVSTDTQVSGDAATASASVSASGFSTSAGNELLLALVATDYLAGSNTTVTSVTGGGLTWSLVVRTNAQSGSSEIWRAMSPSPLSNVTVTANLSQSVIASITVLSFSGVNTSGTNGSGAIGATKSANAKSGAPTATLVTTGNNSLVIGVGNDYDNAIARTPGTGQSLLHQYLTPSGDTYWMQLLDTPVLQSGTSATINDTAPTTDRYNLSICEILASTAQTFSISGTITPSAAASSTQIILSGAASATTTANGSGNYSFTNLASGNYTVTPNSSSYTFNPTSQAVTVAGANVSAVNFAGTAVPTYAVSGSISPASAGSGATVMLSATGEGGSSQTVTADGSGNFTFPSVQNGTYTITPTRTGYSFSPSDLPVTVAGAAVTGLSFTGTATATYSISGTISPAASGSGATVTLSGTSGGTTTADGSGNYTFTGLANGSYTVTPSKSGFTFAPTSQPVTVSGANVTAVNFTATAATYSISGTISPAASGSGALVTLSGTSGGTTTADGSGNYSFTGLANGSYTVTPSKSGFTFAPTSQPVTVSGANVASVNFTATAVTYSVSGTISPAASGSGATVTLSGTSGGTTTANGSGNYSFTGLANGSYTVTPTKSGFSFTPASQNLTVSGANLTGVNFTAQSSGTGLAIDADISTDGKSASSTIATPVFSTTGSNELLLAFVATDYISGTNTTVTQVAGAGLTWVLVIRTNTQSGTAEIWRAFAASPLTNATVTATLSQSVVSSITALSFTGVDTTGTNGSGAIGATASKNSRKAAPSASLVTTRNGSWVFGVGNDFDNAIARTVGPNQSLVHQDLTSTGDTYWVQMQNAPTPLSGTTVTINDTAPTGDRFNLSLVEVLP